MAVTAASSQVTDTIFLTLTVNPRLTLTAQPATRTVLPGDTAVYTLSVSASEGFHLPVALALQGAPSGAVVSFDSNPLTPPGEGQLRVTTAASTVIGTYALTVTAASSQVTDTTFLTLTVNPRLVLAAQPGIHTVIPGDTAVYTISVDASEGFTEPVDLALQDAPPDSDASFDSNPVTSPGTSQLCISTTTATMAGTYAMTVSGASRVLTDTTNLILIVTSETPSFTLSISPTTRAAKPNQIVSYTVVLSMAGSLSWPVTLTVVGLPTGVGAAWSANPVMPGGSSILALSIPDKPSYGEHLLQVVGTASTQTVAHGIELVIDYPFKIYLPIVQNIGESLTTHSIPVCQLPQN
jgi:hypothetical protein